MAARSSSGFGNRTSQTKFGTTTSYSYDAGDQLTSTTSGGTTTNYTYDNDGQQTGQGTKTFTYDLAGRLTQVKDGATTLASYTYDGNGNRLTKTAGSSTITYRWDENNDLPMLAVEQQGSTTLRSYQYGTSLISMISGGASYYFHHDNTDSTAAITKSTGATEWTYTYTPYGEARQTTKVDPNAPDNPIQYAGQFLDSESGFYNLRARAYNPVDGNFLSPDPITRDSSYPDVSTYAYAGDDPIQASDPSGLAPVWDDANGNTRKALPCPAGGWWFISRDECAAPEQALQSDQPPPSPSDQPPTGTHRAGGRTASAATGRGTHPAATAQSGTTDSATTALDLDRFLDYIRRYWDSYNPRYEVAKNGWGSINDCTNFISQALHYAGMPETKDWKYEAPQFLQTLPFPTKIGGGTPAWVNVKAFIAYAVKSGAASLVPATRPRVGDVICADWQGGPPGTAGFRPDHLMAVTSLGPGRQVNIASHVGTNGVTGRFDFPLYARPGIPQNKSVQGLEPQATFMVLRFNWKK